MIDKLVYCRSDDKGNINADDIISVGDGTTYTFRNFVMAAMY